ncbi:hypothetical protein [Intestinibacillus massiliensis]|uniref:hypothetical protein n=1 Tax=Intestinibacillus massiliensis TaxID=1871029 RepID=UPI00135637AD|nr:hypothetical protein [Intestinibacillus massiliensis]
MYYIRIMVDGRCKYLYNHRVAVFLQEYAKAFPTEQAARKYMEGKQVAKEHPWWIVERK